MQRRWVAGSVAGLTLLVAACGGGSKSSSAGSGSTSGGSGLPGAITSMEHSAETITFSSFGDVSEFAKLGGGTGSTAKDAATIERLLPQSSLVVSIEPGSAQSGKFELSVNLPSDQKAVDMIVDAGTLYARADVKGIASAAGADASKLTSGASSVEGTFPWITALLDGKYVSVNLKQLGALAKQFTGGSGASGSGATGTTIATPSVKSIESALSSALTSGASIKDMGSDSTGEHFQVSVMPKDFLGALSSSLSGALGPLSSELGKYQNDLSKVSNTPVVVDAWVKSGHLSQMEINVLQFDPTAIGMSPAGLKIDFASESGAISAPSGATAIDLSTIGNLISSFMGGLH